LVVPSSTTFLKSGRCSINAPLKWCVDAAHKAQLELRKQVGETYVDGRGLDQLIAEVQING
jgi:hypothetical protein